MTLSTEDVLLAGSRELAQRTDPGHYSANRGYTANALNPIV